MSSKAFVVSALVALAQARFGEEQAVASIISALSNFGQPGQAATLAGATPGVLLAGANACAKLTLADKIISELGTDPAVIAGAAKLVEAEKNFNPFSVSIPSICGDATLPATEALRGIVPLVDPAVGGSDVENANAAKSLTTPFNAAGLSVADVMKANGFTNFTIQNADGSAGSAASVAAGSANTAASSAAAATTAVAAAATTNCAAPQTITTTVIADAATTAAATAVASSAAAATTAAVSSSGVQQSTIAGLDFGSCVPTIKFEAGLNGRKTTEFTFQAIDNSINTIQQEALNPNIITNRICDELTNHCNANAAAKTACTSAKATIAALTVRDVTVADQWNTLLGFAGTNTNPDNAPKPGLKGQGGQ